MPDFELENLYEGPVCGIDEVGRGPLAGPVVAACVLIPYEKRNLDFVSSIKDSKKIPKPKRLLLDELIRQNFYTAVSVIDVETIDRINILQAALQAMKESLENLFKQTHILHALIDGNRTPTSLLCSASPIVKGDNRSISIAAASIIAKVHRDKIMEQLDSEYPNYGWKKNSGYPTPDHLSALKIYGITPHHRQSFGPVKAVLAKTA